MRCVEILKHFNHNKNKIYKSRFHIKIGEVQIKKGQFQLKIINNQIFKNSNPNVWMLLSFYTLFGSEIIQVLN